MHDRNGGGNWLDIDWQADNTFGICAPPHCTLVVTACMHVCMPYEIDVYTSECMLTLLMVSILKSISVSLNVWAKGHQEKFPSSRSIQPGQGQRLLTVWEHNTVWQQLFPCISQHAVPRAAAPAPLYAQRLQHCNGNLTAAYSVAVACRACSPRTALW